MSGKNSKTLTHKYTLRSNKPSSYSDGLFDRIIPYICHSSLHVYYISYAIQIMEMGPKLQV